MMKRDTSAAAYNYWKMKKFSAANRPGEIGGLKVIVFPPAVWQPLVETSFKGLVGRERPLAEAMLCHFHGQHVGIGVTSITNLARFALDIWLGVQGPCGHRKELTPWDALARRVWADDIQGTGWHGHGTSLGGSGLRKLLFLLGRLVQPLVVAADRELGRTFLFGSEGHDMPKGIGGPAYHEHEGRQTDWIERFLRDPDGISPLATEETRLVFSAWGRFSACRSVAGLPRCDLRALGCYFRLPAPDLSASEPTLKEATLLASQASRRSGMRPSQDGVTGIRVTRRLEDLDQMLLTEYLYPKSVFFERLTGSGFNALRRPPPREQPRDVLVLGLFIGTDSDPDWHLAQAAWLLNLLGLSAKLVESGMRASDLVWIRVDARGGLHTRAASLSELHWTPPAGGLYERDSRLQFLQQLGWMPELTDRRSGDRGGERFANAVVQPPKGSLTPEVVGKQVRELLRSTLPTLVADWQQDKDAQQGEGVLEQYTQVLLNLLVPVPRPSVRREHAHDGVADWVRRLRIHLPAGTHTGVRSTIVLVPRAQGDGAWHCYSERRHLTHPVAPGQRREGTEVKWLGTTLLAANLGALTDG